MDRREARRQYKQRAVARGVYAVRCPSLGLAWVGMSRDLRASRNRLSFAMEMDDSHFAADLREHWRALGEQAFVFETLEELDAELASLLVEDVLKQRRDAWLEKLQAQKI